MLGAKLALLLATTAAASNEAGQRFLEENKRRDGVVVLPSGLQYKVLRSGDGEHHPTVGSSCECHYEGRTAQQWPEGETFDSSYKRGSPTSFAPNQVIKGWTEAMQLMVEGARHLRGAPPVQRQPARAAAAADALRLDLRRQVGDVHPVRARLRRARLAAQDRRRRRPRLYDGDTED